MHRRKIPLIILSLIFYTLGCYLGVIFSLGSDLSIFFFNTIVFYSALPIHLLALGFYAYALADVLASARNQSEFPAIVLALLVVFPCIIFIFMLVVGPMTNF